MSYNSAIPVATDTMLKSQGQINANFQAINQAFAQNHESLTTDNTISGRHRVVTFQEQIGDPATTADQIAIYTKAVSGLPALFMRPNNSQTPIQLTYSSISTGLQSTNPNVYISQQYSFVAGPFVVFCGKINAIQGVLIPLTPATTLIYANVTSNETVDVFLAATAVISGGDFTILTHAASASPQNWSYFAIGKP